MYVYSISLMPGQRFNTEQALAKINELAGRSIGSYILKTAIPGAHRRSGGKRASAYVAAGRKSPARLDEGVPGFTVRRERVVNGQPVHPSVGGDSRGE